MPFWLTELIGYSASALLLVSITQKSVDTLSTIALCGSALLLI